MDAEKLIAYLEPNLRDLEKAQKVVDEAELKQFHAQADVADSRHNVFKLADALVKKACEENPFDPRVQEWKEFVDEWRKQMPKE